MDNYIYRVLNNFDEGSNEILCKEQMNYVPLTALLGFDYCVGDALDNVTSHIISGNNKTSVWISCSKSFNVLEHFATMQEDRRPMFAIIKNHNQSTINSQKFLNYYNEYRETQNSEKFIAQVRNMKLKEIEKLVFDFSDRYDRLYNWLIKQHVIRMKNKEQSIKLVESDREIYYAQKQKEVLVLSKIPASDCMKLYPLQYDVLYALIENGSVKNIHDDIIQMLLNDLNIPCTHVTYPINDINMIKMILDHLPVHLKKLFESFDDSEKFFFIELYIKRTSVFNIWNQGYDEQLIVNSLVQILQKTIMMLNQHRLTGFCTDEIHILPFQKTKIK